MATPDWRGGVVTAEQQYHLLDRKEVRLSVWGSALALYYLDGLSTAEMARLLNITEAAVRQRVSRARRQLQVDGSLG